MEKTKLDENEVSPEMVAYLKAKGLKPKEGTEQPKKPESQITAEDIQQFINNKKTN